ncbi:MAG: hypothetical protein ACPGQS_05540 [Bradymonadia bacterium]
MKNFNVITVSLLLFVGCAQPLSSDGTTPFNGQRLLPKSYEAPTGESITNESTWSHAGALFVDGSTKLGELSSLTGFDTQLDEGMRVELLGFSSGWTSMHIFGAEPDSGVWTEVVTLSLSEPLDPQVEAGELAFDVPFSGHYLLMLEPVLEEEVEYLLRLECREGC